MGFVHRSLYGHYLSDVFANIRVPAGSALGRTMGTVTDVRRDHGQLAVHLSNGWRLEADKVVLALGNPPPRRIPVLEKRGGYVRDPWVPDLLEQVGQAPEVLLLGTGLTMVDVVGQLHDALPMTRFTAVSRHGYLPATHRRSSNRLHDAFHPGNASLPVLQQRVQDRITEISEIGGDWRDVIDSVRAAANDLWRGLTAEEQDVFVASVARRWDTARHRMSPHLADLVSRLRSAGRLRIATTADVDPTSFPVVVNCTGPAPVPTRGWNPLVDTLLGRGAIRAHRLGLGLDLDEHGRIIDDGGQVDPDVFAVGAARKGVEWEVIAVPDLRGQAVRMADLLSAEHEARSAAPVSGTA